MPKISKVKKARALKARRMIEILKAKKLNKARDATNEEYKEVLPMTEEEWLSCQTDVNKLVQPNSVTDETYFVPVEESILPEIASDVADTKDFLPTQPNIIDEEFIPEEKCFPENKNILGIEGDEWVLQQSLCRCCHAEGTFNSLQDTAPSERITYNDMLSTCFNIQLFPVSGALSGALGALCALCAARLRDAYSFTHQVRACEARLLQLCRKNCIKVSSIEIEVKAEEPHANEDAVFKMDAHESSSDGISDPGFDMDKEDSSDFAPVEQKVKPKKVTPKRKIIKKSETEKSKNPVKGQTLLEQALPSAPRKKPGHVLPPDYYTRVGDSFKCSRCVKSFHNRHGVREHFKIVHLKLTRDFNCTHCPKIFKTYIRLTIHKLEAHNINERVKCNACERMFNTQKQLMMHMDTYHMMGEKVQCSMCDYECYDKGTLKKHLVKHQTTKDFHCKYCKKSFLRKTNLRIHEKIHTGDKRKACAECGQAFVQKASLNYHMAKYHPGVKF